MAVTTTETEPAREQPSPRPSSTNDIEKVNDTVHTEHRDKITEDYIPQDDAQYVVTFKTWIVVTVRTPFSPL